MTFNLTDVTCQTFSFGRILIDYVFGAAINITHGNHDGGDEDGRYGYVVRRADKLGGYCAAKVTPLIKTFA